MESQIQCHEGRFCVMDKKDSFKKEKIIEQDNA